MTPREEQQLRESLGLPIESDSADIGSAIARREHAQLVRVYEAFDHEHETQTQELLAMLPDGAPPQAAGIGSALGRLGGFVMHAIRKHTFAAVLLPAACLMIVAFFVINTTSQTAFAKVVERLREIHSARCKFVLKTLGADGKPLAPDSVGEFVLTEQHGSRQDLFSGSELITSSYFLPDGSMATIVPATKMMQRIAAHPGKSGPGANMLQGWLLLLKQSDGQADRELGTRVIEGRVCVGFELNGERFGIPAGKNGARQTIELWVEPDGSLPVLMELRVPLPNDGGTVIAQYVEFEWNPPIDVATLTPPSSEGMNEINLEMPVSNEQTLIDALRDYAEVLGEYPSELDPGTTAGAFIAKLMASGKLGDPASKEFQQQLSERAMIIGAGAGYFQGLYVQKFEPQYFGDAVKPGDSTAILASWNAEGGGRRVIYGDLRVATVDSPN
ncbi:MAG: hypothetical protein ACKVS9_03565 [Phycisphaerae bacterium]